MLDDLRRLTQTSSNPAMLLMDMRGAGALNPATMVEADGVSFRTAVQCNVPPPSTVQRGVLFAEHNPVRWQPTQTQIGSALTLQYYYCPNGGTNCSTNNGDMMRQVITTPSVGPLTQDYQYTDGFDRLTNVVETRQVNGQTQQTWSQTFQYDSYGNGALTGGYNPYPTLTPGSLLQFDTHNHWNGAGYDPAGNTTSLSQQSFTYDAENRLTASTQQGIGAISYIFDGDGKRVAKSVGTSVTTFVYDAAGQLAAEYGGAPNPGLTYLSVDHLGSTRLLQRAAGSQYFDYTPFGLDVTAGMGGRNSTYATGVYPANPDTESVKFTGKERDAETGLDYFGARYFSGAQGRFTSPDPVHILKQKLVDPQQWNMYAYVRNTHCD